MTVGSVTVKVTNGRLGNPYFSTQVLQSSAAISGRNMKLVRPHLLDRRVTSEARESMAAGVINRI